MACANETIDDVNTPPLLPSPSLRSCMSPVGNLFGGILLTTAHARSSFVR